MMRRVHRERALAAVWAAGVADAGRPPARRRGIARPLEWARRSLRPARPHRPGHGHDHLRLPRRRRPGHEAGARDARPGQRGAQRGRRPATPSGTPYRADDPELLLWVLFTLFDSSVVVYRAYVGALDRGEEAALWRDYRIVGGLFGLAPDQMPRDARRRSTATATRCSTATASTSRTGRASERARSCSSRRFRWRRARSSRRRTSSPITLLPDRIRARVRVLAACRRSRFAARWSPAAPST